MEALLDKQCERLRDEGLLDVGAEGRRGKKKAIVAVGRSILVIVWQLLATEQATFTDLGPDYYDSRGGTQRAVRNHIRSLQALGYQVTLQAAA